MPEHTPIDFPVPHNAEDPKLTFEALLLDPNLPDALRPHVERHVARHALAETAQADPETHEPQPAAPTTATSAETDLADLGQVATLFRNKTEAILQGQPLEERHTVRFSDETTAALKKANYSTDQLGTLIQATHETALAYETKYAEARESELQRPRYLTVLKGLSGAPAEELRNVYHSPEHGPALRAMLEDAPTTEEALQGVNLLLKIHKKKNILDLRPPLTPPGDTTLDAFFAREDAADLMIATLRNQQQELSQRPFNDYARTWGRRFLGEVVGLPKKDYQNLLFDSLSRTSTETHDVHFSKFTEMLSTVAATVKQIGPENRQLVREKAGIINLDYFKPDQLELMANVIKGDEKTLEHLRAGDVTVVFVDTGDDYNGAMKNKSELFATPKGRTVYFEVDHPTDYYRGMVLLKQRGIKPSTLVVAAHGNRRVIGQGRSGLIERRGIRLTHLHRDQLTDQDRTDVYLQDAEGISRIVEEFMQDSRGVDDNPSAYGRRRVVFASCLIAKPARVWRPREPAHTTLGQLWQRLVTPFPHKSTKESMAETVLKRAGVANLDVYAANIPQASTRTSQGIRYNRVVKQRDGGVRTAPHRATHLRLDEAGKVRKRRPTEVLLRRKPHRRSQESEAA